jgi:hypothetical protein
LFEKAVIGFQWKADENDDNRAVQQEGDVNNER